MLKTFLFISFKINNNINIKSKTAVVVEVLKVLKQPSINVGMGIVTVDNCVKRLWRNVDKLKVLKTHMWKTMWKLLKC